MPAVRARVSIFDAIPGAFSGVTSPPPSRYLVVQSNICSPAASILASTGGQYCSNAALVCSHSQSKNSGTFSRSQAQAGFSFSQSQAKNRGTFSRSQAHSSRTIARPADSTALPPFTITGHVALIDSSNAISR